MEREHLLPTHPHKGSWEVKLTSERRMTDQQPIRYMQNILQRLSSRKKDLVAINWFKDNSTAREVMCQSKKEVVHKEPRRK